MMVKGGGVQDRGGVRWILIRQGLFCFVLFRCGLFVWEMNGCCCGAPVAGYAASGVE
jgi:hypothetical protein